MAIDTSRFTIHPEVKDALASGQAVVALESTIISHGLPSPRNVAVAGDIEQSVRDGGAVPATIAIIDGVVKVGLTPAELEILGDPNSNVIKVSTRDLGPVLAAGGHGATTVSATSHIAHLAGIKYFATGGLGGVHRGAQDTYDESGDLVTLARTPITVTCAGVKSILDVGATLERLETLGVTVVGFGTDAVPRFLSRRFWLWCDLARGHCCPSRSRWNSTRRNSSNPAQSSSQSRLPKPINSTLRYMIACLLKVWRLLIRQELLEKM